MPELPRSAPSPRFSTTASPDCPSAASTLLRLPCSRSPIRRTRRWTGRTVVSAGRIGQYLVHPYRPRRRGHPSRPLCRRSRRGDSPGHPPVPGGLAALERKLSQVPPKPGGKGPIALRIAGCPGGIRRHRGRHPETAGWVVRDPKDVERIATLGPDALGLGRERFGEIRAARGTDQESAHDQRVIAGIGNAYRTRSCRGRTSPVRHIEHAR